MNTVGSFEARTRLSRLLDQAARGEEITITRHGKPVAKLVPYTVARPKGDIRKAVEDMRRFQKEHGRMLGPELAVKELIETGRRL